MERSNHISRRTAIQAMTTGAVATAIHVNSGSKLLAQEAVGVSRALTPFETAGLAEITDRCHKVKDRFFIYSDVGDGYNIGRPGQYGVANIDFGAIHNPNSPDGIEADPNRIDFQHGTVIEAVFGPFSTASQFGGVYFSIPTTLDLSTPVNMAVVLEVCSPTGGFFEFKLGGASSGFRQIPQSTIPINFGELRIPLTEFAGLNRSAVNELLNVATTGAQGLGSRTLLLRNIHLDPPPVFVNSWNGLPFEHKTFGIRPKNVIAGQLVPVDQVNKAASSYGASLCGLVCSALQTPSVAQVENLLIVADAFVAIMNNDNVGNPDHQIPSAPDGSKAIPNLLLPGRPHTLDGQFLRLSGFPGPNPPYFFLHETGCTGGNLSFCILMLLAAHRVTQNPIYLNKARELGRWIRLMLKSNDGRKGYFVGYQGQNGNPLQLLTGKSCENVADIHSAMMALRAVELRLGNTVAAAMWAEEARHAGDFVMSLVQQVSSSQMRFALGTTRQGTVDIVDQREFLDASSFAMLALSGSPQYRARIDWRQVVRYLKARYAKTITANGLQFSGFTLQPDSLSILPEFMSQVISCMRYANALYGTTEFNPDINFYQSELTRIQTLAPFAFDDPSIVAQSIVAGIRNGEDDDTLPFPPEEQMVETEFQRIPERGGISATAFGVIASLGCNPFMLDGPISMNRPEPGWAGVVNRIRVAGATPFTPVKLFWSPLSGTTVIPGCPLPILLKTPSVATATADAHGIATFAFTVSPTFKGKTLHYQALILDRCVTSSVISHQFK